MSAAAMALVAGTATAARPPVTAGPSPDGSAVTPVGYRVTPAGTQTPLGDLPLAVQLSPNGRLLAVSNDGQGEQSLQLVDTATSAVVQSIPYKSPASLFMGLAFSPDGSTLYASGGGDEKIHVYSVAGEKLAETTPIQLPKKSPSGGTVNLYPSGLAVTADGRRLVVADHLADAASVIELATGAVSTVAVGHAPIAVAIMADDRTAVVTNQGGNTLSVLDLSGATPGVTTTVTVGTHPNAAILDRAARHLYVADGDSDQVNVIETSSWTVSSTIEMAPYPGARVGTNPVALALSQDGSTLYVANAGNNDVDVVDIAAGRVAGSIPTAWYPSAVAATHGKLFVANAKGLGAGPNDGSGYPNPTSSAPTNPAEYAGSMMVGTLSTVPLPVGQGQLGSWTRTVASNDGFRNQGRGDNGEGLPPIEHVIYVLRENRTYDQEFGSLGKGMGDPTLNLFGDESATNARSLERRFVTLDNFYADAEVSAQGWNWGVAANSNPFSEMLWPANYSGRNAPYPSENGDPAIAPNRTQATAYIWDSLAAGHVPFRNYGFYVSPDASNQEHAADPVLDANTDHGYRGFDMNCPENADTFTPLATNCGTPRISAWLNEFQGYVANHDLPTVELVRMPNDHTSGTRPGSPTPQAYVADNDLALGRLVDAVSHSPYWKSTAIFVTEDDAQNGPDHIDAHRTTSEVISPYTQTGRIDSTFYSTVSMLRTIEDLVGIRPLTQFDTYATPMFASFTDEPNLAPYSAVRPADAGNVRNGVSAPLAALSAAQPLGKEDQIDMGVFNEAIWQSVKGAGATMPPPQHNLPGTSSTAPDANDAGGGG